MVIVAQPVVHLIVLNRHFRHQEVRNPKEKENTYVVFGRIQVQEGEFQDDPVALFVADLQGCCYGLRDRRDPLAAP